MLQYINATLLHIKYIDMEYNTTPGYKYTEGIHTPHTCIGIRKSRYSINRYDVEGRTLLIVKFVH